MEFDFRTGIITVYRHLENVTETYDVKGVVGSHNGGDNMLAENFIGVMQGVEKSRSTLAEGILSASVCLMAKKSSEEYKFCEIQ